MGNIVFNQAAKFLSKRRNTRRWIAAVLCLALVVTSGTFGMLMRHGSALSNTKMLDCAFEVHEHSNACYDEAGELVCGYADYCVHTHNDDCYDSENNLVCKLPEIEAHVHEDSCFEEEQCLICEMEETEGHQHTEECYQIEQNELTCTMEEHVHDDSCYELIPEGEEIPQDESTAPSEAPVPNEETSPSEEPVQNQESSATETPAQNPEAPATEAPATEAPAENQEAPVTDPEAPVTEAPADQTPAESQPAPENQPAPQSEEPTAEGEVARIAGLTKCVENRRLTCTMEEHTHSENCYNQTKVLICEEEETSEPHTHTEECYETKMVAKCGQLELHTHSDACYTDGKLTCGQLELVEHIHGEECFKDVPVMELTAQVDNVTITVSATQEGIIPAGAELSVTPVVKTETEVLENLEDETQKAQAEALNAMYDEIQQGLETSMEDDDTREIKDFLAYDISFYKENENSQKEEVQLDGQVNVKLEFAQDALPEEIASNQDVQIENVDVYDVKETEEGRTAQVQQDAVVDTAQSADNGAVPAQDAGVRKVETTLSDSSTIAIAWIGEIDPETGEYVYEDDDVIIRVSALVEGAIPENAKLQVVPIIASQETGEQYQQVAEKLLEQAENKEYEIAGFLAYDISFVDEEGNKIEPNGEVKVSMNYKEAMIPAEVDATAYALAAEEETSQGEAAVEPELNVKVMHLEESSEGSVNVVDMAEENKVTALETTEEQKIQNAEFVTGGFSVFTITWTWDTSTPYVYEDDQVKITITAIDKDAIPKGTSLAITPIKADDVDTAQQYQEVARKLMEKAAGESYDIEGFLAYDISLIGEDGQEIEPDGKVKVTMEYKQPMAVVEIDPETYALVKQELAEKAEDVEAGQQPSSTEEDMATSQESMENAPVDQENSVTDNSETVENPVAQTENMMNRTLTDSSDETSQDEAQTDLGTPEEDNAAEIPEVQSQLSITVMHLEEDDNGEVAQVVDMMAENKVQSLEATEEQEIQKAEFITDSFSSFAIVWAEMNQVIGNVKFWDIEAKKEIEVANPEDYRLVLSNYGSINSTAINEGYDDAKKYTTIKDVQGKKYVFAEMKVADKSTRTPEQGESIDVIINYEGKFAYPGGDGIPVPFAEDKECYFLYNATDPLPTINTIDHKKSGITMRMINHRDRDGNQTTTAGQGGSGANGLMDIVKTEGHYDSTGKWVPPEIEAMGTKVGVYPDLVQKKLINGYPVLKDGTSLSQLFAGGTEVNNLFSEDKFNGTGYFEYDSSENYAHLNDDGNFTVYSLVGAPKGQGEAYAAALKAVPIQGVPGGI